MPAFTLYGSLGSSNTDRVRLTLAEGGFTDFELVLLNLRRREQKVSDSTNTCFFASKSDLSKFTLMKQSKEHEKRHPWGKVPALTTADGFTLYESRAICKYLATKFSFPLLPPSSDIEATALFDQAQSVEILYFSEPAGRISFEKIAKRFMGLASDEAAVSNALRSLEEFFDIQERLLQDRDYMAGDEFTLVDIYYIPLIQRLFACGYGDIIVSREAVNAWWERCVHRPTVQKMSAADREAVLYPKK